MNPDPYGDRDLVALYDHDNPGGVDHDYYRALADEIGARSIVDLGCGTGLLTRSLVAPDRTVVGVDPSATMLDWARRQPGSEAVTWILGTAADIEPDATVDLVVCTGNAIMHVSPDELPTTLRSTAAALRPGGTFSFESRNPDFREWEHWTPEVTYGERDMHLGRLREWLEVTEVSDGRVVFDAYNVLPDDEVRVYTSVLYFRGADELVDALHDAGFHSATVHGGWHGQPVTADSRVLVVRAQRR
jgi:SAM-dependent methyltransferase